MECRPHVLTEHEVQIFSAGFHKSLAADPAADEMDEGVDSAEFSGNSLRRGANRIPIPQVNHGGEETLSREIQVAGQGIQFILIVIKQNQGMSARGKRVRGFVPQRAGCPGDRQ